MSVHFQKPVSFHTESCPAAGNNLRSPSLTSVISNLRTPGVWFALADHSISVNSGDFELESLYGMWEARGGEVATQDEHRWWVSIPGKSSSEWLVKIMFENQKSNNKWFIQKLHAKNSATHTVDTQMNSGNLREFQSCNTLVEVCGGSLPSFHCIPPSTPSLMQFKTHIKRKKPKYQYLRIYTVSWVIQNDLGIQRLTSHLVLVMSEDLLGLVLSRVLKEE